MEQNRKVVLVETTIEKEKIEENVHIYTVKPGYTVNGASDGYDDDSKSFVNVGHGEQRKSFNVLCIDELNKETSNKVTFVFDAAVYDKFSKYMEEYGDGVFDYIMVIPV